MFSAQSVFPTCKKLCIWDYFLLQSSTTTTSSTAPFPEPAFPEDPVDLRDWDPVDLSDEADKKGICGWSRIKETGEAVPG